MCNKIESRKWKWREWNGEYRFVCANCLALCLHFSNLIFCVKWTARCAHYLVLHFDFCFVRAMRIAHWQQLEKRERHNAIVKHIASIHYYLRWLQPDTRCAQLLHFNWWNYFHFHLVENVRRERKQIALVCQSAQLICDTRDDVKNEKTKQATMALGKLLGINKIVRRRRSVCGVRTSLNVSAKSMINKVKSKCARISKRNYDLHSSVSFSSSFSVQHSNLIRVSARASAHLWSMRSHMCSPICLLFAYWQRKIAERATV